MLTAKDEKDNGCIVNTCVQVGANPTRIAISCQMGNLTREIIEKTGAFNVSVLTLDVPFETIRHFGMQSGRDVDKFAGIDYALDKNGVPYLPGQSCAYLSCRVLSSQDLGSHTLFIAEVEDGDVLSSGEPLTYAYYQNVLKPKPAPKVVEKKIVGWRCKICNYVYEGAELPADYMCPLCGHPAEDFEPIYAE